MNWLGQQWKTIAKTTLILFASLLVIMWAVPLLFHNYISSKIIDTAESYLKSELQFQDAEVSFFHEFPSLTVRIKKLQLTGSGPFPEQNLLEAKSLDLSVSLWRLLLSNHVKFEEISLNEALIHLQVDPLGRPNYLILEEQEEDSESTTRLTLQKLSISDTKLSYEDALNEVYTHINDLNYQGSGTYNEEGLHLESALNMAVVDLITQQQRLLEDKSVEANLTTQYNEEASRLSLENDKLKINDLVVTFSGEMEFKPEGYAYEAHLKTLESHFAELLSLLPPNYKTWQQDTEVDGTLNASIYLNGFNSTSKNQPSDFKMNALAEFREGSLKYAKAPVPLEDMLLDFEMTYDNEQFEIHADTLSFTVGEDFSRGHLFAKGGIDDFNIKARVHTELDLHLLQESLQLPDISFGGHLKGDINAYGRYNPEKKLFPKSDSELVVTDGFLQTSFPDPMEDVFIDFEFINTTGNYEDSSIDLKDFSFVFEENPFDLKVRLSNMRMPDYDIQAKGSLDLNNFTQMVPIPYISGANGFVRLDARFKGHAIPGKNGEAPDFDISANSGTLFLENVALRSKVLPEPFEIIHGDFTFQLDRLEFSDFELKYANNYSLLNGYFTNYIPYLLVPGMALEGDFTLKSQRIDVDALIPSEPDLAQVQTDSLAQVPAEELQVDENFTGVLRVPDNISFKLNVDIDSLNYKQLTAEHFKGQMTITKGGFVFNDTRMELVGGDADLQGYYSPKSDEEAVFDFKLKANNLDIKRAYDEIDLFRDLVPAAQSATGVVDLDYEVEGAMDETMQPVLPSLIGGGTLEARNVQFKNYKFFGTVSKKTRLNALNDPKMERITVVSKIDNNLLEMERFKFKLRPFRLRMEGQTTLDGDMDLQMRLGLPPFGLIGIPIKITGETDSMKIKVGRREKDLKELVYDDDELTQQERERFLMLRDSITESMSIEEIQAFEKKMDSVYFYKPPAVNPETVKTDSTAADQTKK